MKKIAIIGSSIAGSALAYLLAKSGCSVKVFEQKSQEDVGRKVCANIVTYDFIRIMEHLGLDAKRIVRNRFKRAIFFSEKNSAEFPVDDYEIDRNMLLEMLVKKAKAAGAKFCFKTEFVDFDGHNEYEITLKRNKKIITEKADYLIGADGALSRVAKKIGLKKEFWLATQAKIPNKLNGKEKNKYFIFLGSRFGYYSYIYPSKNYLTVGTVFLAGQKNNFDDFLKYLKIKKAKNIEASLIPIYAPYFNFMKGNVIVIGDAAGMTKSTGGGIIPSLKAAGWARNAILSKRTKILAKLKQELFLHSLICRGLRKMSDEDFDKYLEVAKDKGIVSSVESRDSTKNWIFKIARRKPSLIKLLPKII